MNDKVLSLLGMARRAGRLACGHDAAVESIVKNTAKLCLLASDTSERLKRELSHACTYQNKQIPLRILPCTIAALSHAIGSKAGTVVVTDEGFARKLIALLEEPLHTGKDENYAER